MKRLRPTDIECDHQGGDEYFCAECGPAELILPQVRGVEKAKPGAEPTMKQRTFCVTSSFGAKSWSPYVEVTMGGLTAARFAPEQAREAALSLLAAAEAAEQDGFVVEFFEDTMAPDSAPASERRHLAAHALMAFRSYRESRCPKCQHRKHGFEACDEITCGCPLRINA